MWLRTQYGDLVNFDYCIGVKIRGRTSFRLEAVQGEHEWLLAAGLSVQGALELSSKIGDAIANDACYLDVKRALGELCAEALRAGQDNVNRDD